MLGLESELRLVSCCREGACRGSSRCAREVCGGGKRGLNKYGVSLIRALLHSQEVHTGFPAQWLVG